MQGGQTTARNNLLCSPRRLQTNNKKLLIVFCLKTNSWSLLLAITDFTYENLEIRGKIKVKNFFFIDQFILGSKIKKSVTDLK